MEIADTIQLAILIVLIITAIIALKEISETKNIHKESLLWNKKNKTIDVLNDFRKVIPHLTKKCFSTYLKHPNKKIPVKVILEGISGEHKIKSEIGEYINHHEGLAIGISSNLYDEDLIKTARKTSFFQTWIQYEAYIDHRRQVSNPNAWKNFEELVNKWNIQEYIDDIKRKDKVV